MNWKNILFADGGNPYICKTDREFARICNKYEIIKISKYTYLALLKEK